jgi:polyferredoxin
MAKKERGKRVTKKRPSVKQKVKEESINQSRTLDKRIRFVVKNLIVFLILTVISYVLYWTVEGVYKNFFGSVYVILGIIAIALLLALLILFLLKLIKKRR